MAESPQLSYGLHVKIIGVTGSPGLIRRLKKTVVRNSDGGIEPDQVHVCFDANSVAERIDTITPAGVTMTAREIFRIGRAVTRVIDQAVANRPVLH